VFESNKVAQACNFSTRGMLREEDVGLRPHSENLSQKIYIIKILELKNE
jgi:hypothetical protein